MPSSEFIVYRIYPSAEEAAGLLELLQAEHIDYRTTGYVSNINSSFASVYNSNQIEVRLFPADFNRVEELLKREATKAIANYPKDYYLFSFSNEELLEVIEKPDEWTKEDYLLSEQILKQRNVTLNDATIEQLKKERLETLRIPEKGSNLWNIVGYFSSCLGGLLGVFIGWNMMTSKKTLPDGERIYTYDARTRMVGKWMFYLGIIACVIWSLVALNVYIKKF